VTDPDVHAGLRGLEARVKWQESERLCRPGTV